MRYTPVEPYLGARPIQNFFNPADDVPAALGLGAPVLAMPNGITIKAFDPFFGGGEFMYVRANGTINAFEVVQLAPAFNAGENRYRFEATQCATAANTGRMVGVAMRAMTAGQYGWVCVGGLFPVSTAASIAAGTAIGISATTAGLAAANSAGRQILNANVAAPATTTVVKNANVTAGSPILRVPNVDGWFVGAFVSGTGIPAATTIAGIDPSGLAVTLSANATVSGVAAVTATYNNGTIFYNVVHVNRPFLQGAIT